MRRILVATDGSGAGDRAVTMAARLAKGLDAELAILTVGEHYPNIDIRRFAEAEGTTTGEAIEDFCDAILQRAREIARETGAVNISIRRALGDPAFEILGSIEEVKPDIAVVGRRGRGRLEGLLLGSVSQKLTSLARCAVMVVP